MVLTVLSKIFGFLRDVTLAYVFGASAVSDAYIIAITVPVVLFGVIATGISTGYIPIYSRLEEKKSPEAAKTFTNNLINALFVVCIPLLLAGLFFTEPLVRVFAAGFEGETLDLAVSFTRISIFGIYLTIVIRILSAYLNYQKMFQVPNLIGIPMSIVVILSIYMSDVMDRTTLLPLGYVAALLLQLIILLGFAFRKKFKYKPILDFKDPDLTHMMALAVPVIIGSSATQVNKIVDRSLASGVEVGGVAALNYAVSLNGIIHGVFVVSITTVMYPLITKMATKGDMDGLKNSVHQSIIGVILLVAPATIGAMLFAEPIVRLLFDRGAFDQQAVLLTSDAYFYYSLGMTAVGLRIVLSKAFYSLQDTKTPMINTGVAMVLNIILNFILVGPLGLGGLALATSISAFVATLLLLISLRKKIGRLRLKQTFRSTGKILAASALMGTAAHFFYNYLTPLTGFSAALLITMTVAAPVYFVLLVILKVEETAFILKRFKR
ncbi:putative peptidoglycan lipid II flippase [Salimicrobium flavidum]|uniref:Probable lipid II flippase MurJ n=2 Tax=Salimicrobium flavidum TaxID=570947 RepID=A0A1N7IRB3_9BACI|nr:putative peptidoglycan lipid II flippase [Salimicrobium flavidum]